uniref:Metallo-beta-lactamase domain-containing protein n=1 Tax=Araucaria cunninghamii TaxID=56994 RepID=A0A0D6R7C4_ARACU
MDALTNPLRIANGINLKLFNPLFPSISNTRFSSRSIKSIVTCSSTLTTTPTSTKLQRRPQNVDGEFYVNHECIDCDVCRWMAPETFQRIDGQSAVYKQPTSCKERTAALQALLSCPVASIRTEKPPSDILEVHSTMPLAIDERSLPGVYHCGYHSKKSYGATSYLIKHPEGNILVDSPSYKGKLASQIEALGGARYMFLTHRDDVADNDKWARRLSCDRILHKYEV